MVRTQIQLTPSQLHALRQLSAQTGKSIADLTRQAIDLYLDRQQGAGREALVRRALAVAGRFASGAHDVSAQHDRALAEAFLP